MKWESALTLCRDLQRGTATAVDVMAETYRRIERVNGELNALVNVLDAEANTPLHHAARLGNEELAMDAVQEANSGHPGTAMALAPVAYNLWNKILNFNPAAPEWAARDRFWPAVYDKFGEVTDGPDTPESAEASPA